MFADLRVGGGVDGGVIADLKIGEWLCDCRFKDWVGWLCDWRFKVWMGWLCDCRFKVWMGGCVIADLKGAGDG